MIQGYEKFRVTDVNKENDFEMEVNWSKDKYSNECKVVRFTFPDGKECYVKREHLLALIFAISRSEDQKDLIPLKLSTVRWHESLFELKATKDISKGEKIRFTAKISCDKVSEQEIIQKRKA